MRTRALAILTASLLAGSGAGALAGSAGGAASASSPAACKDATLLPAPSNLARIKVATRCVVNALRSQGHRRKLAYNSTLTGVAQRQCNYMLDHHVFSHKDARGRGVKARAIAAGYNAKTRTFDVGEILAFGANRDATPLGIKDNWLGSHLHKFQLYRGIYKDIGVGVHMGSPVASSGSATYVTYCVVLGVR